MVCDDLSLQNLCTSVIWFDICGLAQLSFSVLRDTYKIVSFVWILHCLQLKSVCLKNNNIWVSHSHLEVEIGSEL